jgi:hypothetical protein
MSLQDAIALTVSFHRTLAPDFGVDPTLRVDPTDALPEWLDDVSVRLREFGQVSKLASLLLEVLARVLPAGERGRFTAEANADLAWCDGMWEKVYYLVAKAIRVPQFAVQLRSSARRRRP